MTWSLVWQVVLGVALVLFACVAVVVTIRGWSDIKALF